MAALTVNNIWYDPPVEQANREAELHELSNMLGDFDSCQTQCLELAALYDQNNDAMLDENEFQDLIEDLLCLRVCGSWFGPGQILRGLLRLDGAGRHIRGGRGRDLRGVLSFQCQPRRPRHVRAEHNSGHDFDLRHAQWAGGALRRTRG